MNQNRKTAKPGVEVAEYSADTGTVETNNPTIKTLDALLKHMKVDLSVWEVEKHVINKWEVAMREPATTICDADGSPLISKKPTGEKWTLWTRKSRKPLHEPLYQVKAWLRRKTPQIRAAESLLATIERKAPILKSPFRRNGAAVKRPRRALEVCVMDPHIGLLCQKPEADAEWDLEIASRVVLETMDDLLDKARKFGPFEQAFMPFGNDFVHSDNVFHTTTAGTLQPEAISWHRVYEAAERVAINMVHKLCLVAEHVHIYEVPGNHSRMADFTLARLLKAYYRGAPHVTVNASASPYKFHHYGCNLIGYEHGHSVSPLRLAALMANEVPDAWHATKDGYREFHLGDQHRKGSSKPSSLEEQGVSVEYIPGLTAGNEWHRLKGFNHQQRGAMAFIWDYTAGPVARLQTNLSRHANNILK